jgi:hypothetical protein
MNRGSQSTEYNVELLRWQIVTYAVCRSQNSLVALTKSLLYLGVRLYELSKLCQASALESPRDPCNPQNVRVYILE